MINIAEEIKKDWTNGTGRTISIQYPANERETYWETIDDAEIVQESMSLTESLTAGNSDFVGCISSVFKFTVNNLSYRKFEGKKIRVWVQPEDSWESIPYFIGFVKDCNITSNQKGVDITCYDVLYSLSNLDVSEWFYDYARRYYARTYYEFRSDLFQYIGIDQKQTTLPNDAQVIKHLSDITVSETDEYKSVYALDLIKSICQINGAFGIINRYGQFEYRYIKLNDYDVLFLPYTLPFSPQENGGSEGGTDKPVFYSYYKSCKYEDYSMNKITRVYVRQSENSKSGYYGDDKKYKYIVQGNQLTLKTTKDEKSDIARRIFGKIRDMQIFPFEASVDGLPWVEVGDTVRLYVYDFEASEKAHRDVYTIKSFIVLNRTLKGLAGMTDTVSATVSKAQKKYISDMNVREAESVEELSDKIDATDTKVSEIDTTVSGYGDDIRTLQENYWDVQSVVELPENPDPRTIYLIQGSVG